MSQHPLAFWSLSTTEMLRQLQTATEGLTSDEVRERLARDGPNLLKPPKRSDVFTLLFAQFKSPLVLILFFATGLSFFLHDPADAFIILAIVLLSGFLGFCHERDASNAVEKLLSIVRIKAPVLRDGSVKEFRSKRLFSHSEKRLARVLNETSAFRQTDAMPAAKMPRMSHETLAEIVGTTRSASHTL